MKKSAKGTGTIRKKTQRRETVWASLKICKLGVDFR